MSNCRFLWWTVTELSFSNKFSFLKKCHCMLFVRSFIFSIYFIGNINVSGVPPLTPLLLIKPYHSFSGPSHSRICIGVPNLVHFNDIPAWSLQRLLSIHIHLWKWQYFQGFFAHSCFKQNFILDQLLMGLIIHFMIISFPFVLNLYQGTSFG